MYCSLNFFFKEDKQTFALLQCQAQHGTLGNVNFNQESNTDNHNQHRQQSGKKAQ